MHTYLNSVDLTNELPIAEVDGANGLNSFYLKRFVARFPGDFNNLNLHLTIKKDEKIVEQFDQYPMELLIDYEHARNTKAIDTDYSFSNFKKLRFEIGSYDNKKFKVGLVFPQEQPDFFP